MPETFKPLAGERLARQILFLVEVDKLKEVQRRSYLVSQNRLENSAEHSWHFALAALVLGEYANEKVDVWRVVQMALIHDLVEIDAGDVLLYDLQARNGQAQKETAAAERIFGLLPEDQRQSFHQLWREFEARETAEARLAAALDRLMPLLHNLVTDGRTWREHSISAGQAYDLNQRIGDGSQELWDWARKEIEHAVAGGCLEKEPSGEPPVD